MDSANANIDNEIEELSKRCVDGENHKHGFCEVSVNVSYFCEIGICLPSKSIDGVLLSVIMLSFVANCYELLR